MRYEIRIRSQHSKGSRRGNFGGPDTYVSVLAIPDGVIAPASNFRAVMKARGISYTYIGEGYAEHSGPRSMLGQAKARAEALVASLRAKEAVRS